MKKQKFNFLVLNGWRFSTMLVLLLGAFWASFFRVNPAHAAKLEITEDTVWEKEEAPRILEESVIVEEGATLTIQAGNRIEFREKAVMNIYGTLIIDGSKQNPVYIYRKKRLDGQPQNRSRLSFGGNSQGTIKGLNLREMGGNTDSGGRLAGISLRGNSQVEIEESLITHNYWPLELHDNTFLKMRNCEIYENHSNQALIVKDDTAVADVRENFWGKDEGPGEHGAEISGPNIDYLPVEEKGRRPIVLVPGFGESLNFEKFLTENDSNNWFLFPSSKNTNGLKQILETAGYEENKNLFIAFYDWRRPVEENVANYLKPLLDEIRAKNDFWEVELIGFSFGGLVARGYLQRDDYPFDVSTLVTIGTPHQGAAKIYPFAEGGIIPKGWSPLIYLYLWYDQTATDYLRMEYVHHKLPAVYDLLPVYDFLRDKNSGELRPWLGLIRWNNTLWHLNEEAIATEKMNLADRTDLYFFSGKNQATLKEITARPLNAVEEIFWGEAWLDGIPDPFSPENDTEEGDGTVLKESAAWEIEEANISTKAVSHSELPVSMNHYLNYALHSDLPNEVADLEPESFLFVTGKDIDNLEIADSTGNLLSLVIKTIPGGALIASADGKEKIALIPQNDNPKSNYYLKIKKENPGEGQLLIYYWQEKEDWYRGFNAENHLESKNKDFPEKEININTTEINEEINLVIGKEVSAEEENSDEKLIKLEIRDNLPGDYEILIKKVKEYYPEQIKTWDVRQGILSRLLELREIEEKGDSEAKETIKAELKMEIELYKVIGLITETAYQSLTEALDKL